MDDKDLDKIIDFMIEVESFNTVYRDVRTSDARQESDSEHSWHLAFLVLLLKDKINSELNFNKMLQLAIIHDLPELYAGDLNPYVDDYSNKQEEERKATEKILSKLPITSTKHIKELFEEYDAQESKESKLVRSLDKVLPMISSIKTVKDFSAYKKFNVNDKSCREYNSKFTQDSKLSKEVFETVFKKAKEAKMFYDK